MAHSTSETAFATIEKSFTYRGNREHWSNAYHFDQVPADTAHWAELCRIIYTLEQAFLPTNVQFEHYYGHNPGTPPVLVYESDLAPAGEGGPPGGYNPSVAAHRAPGDAAAWIRYGTTQRNTLGKPIWLRNYYHGMYSTEGGYDDLLVEQRNIMEALGAQMVTGLNVLGTTFRRAGPKGAVAQNHLTSTWLTTRTLKHRGKHHAFKIPAGSSVQFPPIVVPGELQIN